MKAALFLCLAIGIISEKYVSAKPTQPVAESHHHKRKNCLVLTPEKERQIEEVVERLSAFLNQLTAEMDLIDLRVINLEVDEHDHGDESETVLQLTVNDCVRKEFDPEEFYGTGSASYETQVEPSDSSQTPEEPFIDRTDVADSNKTEDQVKLSDTAPPVEASIVTPVAGTAEVTDITADVPVTNTSKTLTSGIPDVTDTDKTTTKPVGTTSYSITREKTNGIKDQVVQSEIVTSTTSTTDVKERPREINNVYVDYENDIITSSFEENEPYNNNAIQQTSNTNDVTKTPSGDLTDQNENENYTPQPQTRYDERAVTGITEEMISDNPNIENSYEYEDIPISTEAFSEYKDSLELSTDSSNAVDILETPTTDKFSITATPATVEDADTDTDNDTGEYNNQINTSTTPETSNVTKNPDDGSTYDINENKQQKNSSENYDDIKNSSEDGTIGSFEDYLLDSSEDGTIDSFEDDLLDSSEYGDIEENDNADVNDNDAHETDTEYQVQTEATTSAPSNTAANPTIVTGNRETTQIDDYNSNSNVIPEIVYLKLANNGWRYIDDIRRQKSITAPPIVILQDTPNTSKQAQLSNYRGVALAGPTATRVSKFKSSKSISDKSPSTLYYMHLPGVGEQYLKERSKKKGDSPMLVYVESVQPHQTKYVFVD